MAAPFSFFSQSRQQNMTFPQMKKPTFLAGSVLPSLPLSVQIECCRVLDDLTLYKMISGTHENARKVTQGFDLDFWKDRISASDPNKQVNIEAITSPEQAISVWKVLLYDKYVKREGPYYEYANIRLTTDNRLHELLNYCGISAGNYQIISRTPGGKFCLWQYELNVSNGQGGNEKVCLSFNNSTLQWTITSNATNSHAIARKIADRFFSEKNTTESTPLTLAHPTQSDVLVFTNRCNPDAKVNSAMRPACGG